ncbi:MAG: hypothetical protein MJZ03_03600 [archaeon]|nr:hypothetical protein [archaeon]
MENQEFEAIKKAKKQKDAGNFQGALDTLEKYLLIDPYNIKIRMFASQIAFSMKKDSYGLLQLYAIIDFDPDNIDARKCLVTVLKKNKRYNKETEELYKYLIEHCPNDADILNNYAIFCKMQLIDFKRAAEMYEKAISLKPNNADYHLNYAILLIKDLKNFVKGREHLEKAVKLNPANILAKDALTRLIKKKFDGNNLKKGLFSCFKK